MALKNFIKDGSYTRVSRITVDKESDSVQFEIKVYDAENGNQILQPIPFYIAKAQEEEKYKQAVMATAPDYPKLCADRDALTPMWTAESTDKEKSAYTAAKTEYEQAVETLKTTAETDAKDKNEFEKYFSDKQMYEDSNIMVCAYEFLKSRQGFESVVDDE